jgi:hypothetical protein
VAAERQESRFVALDERLECGLVPAPGERYEPLIALQAEQGRASA